MPLWLGVFVAGLIVGASTSAYVIDRAADPSPGVLEPETYTVREGTLGRTVSLTATASWPALDSIYSPASGVVTEADAPSGLFEVGDILLRVEERPMVLIAGEIPAFRELSVGLEGRDVAALQDFLASLGYSVDSRRERYSDLTLAAVSAWQQTLGLPGTGSVEFGDIIILPRNALATPFRWVDEVGLGSQIVESQLLLERLAPVPDLFVEFGNSTPSQIEEGLPGEVFLPGVGLRSVVLGSAENSQGRQTMRLLSADGILCAPELCLDSVPASGETQVSAVFTLVPSTQGALVPVGAVLSDAMGLAYVEMLDRTRRPVTILVSDGGLAIVDGLAVGEKIILP